MQLSNREFKRLVGVRRDTFNEIVKALKDAASHRQTRGCAKKLCLKDQALVCLTYWREYRTYFHIACDWQVSEGTICRTVHWVENVLVNSGRFRLGGKKSLLTLSKNRKQ